MIDSNTIAGIKAMTGKVIGNITKPGNNTGVRPSIRLHLIVGLTVVVILAGGIGGWGATA